MLELPPTPPDDDQTQVPGYATPPSNHATILTPRQTPRGKSQASSTTLLPRQTNEQKQDVAMAPSPADDTILLNGHLDSQIRNDDMSKHVDYIPSNAPTSHMQGDKSPESRHSHGLDVSPLRIRKKRKQISPRLNRAPAQKQEPEGSSDWNDLPADMITNDLYDSIRRRKMERLEAIEDGSAIEAVVLMAETRVPSLRHVKKRHSLRIGSGTTVLSSGISQQSDVVEGASSERRVVSLRHKKAFTPTRQDPEHVFVPAETTGRTLRHERRPLSAGGRPQTSSSLQSMPLSVPEQPRHVSLPLRLKDNSQDLRHSSKEQRFEPVVQTIPSVIATKLVDVPLPTVTLNEYATTALSPSIKSHRFATQTPMSAMSDRTEMELCEAKNVALFPHSNESVLFINHGNIIAKPTVVTGASTFRPLSFTFENPEPSSLTSSDISMGRCLSTPEIQVNGDRAMDSPLTNPRQAPLPPAIQFIPPTPSIEGDRQVRIQDDSALPPAKSELQRRGSIMRTARRLSGTLLTPFMLRSNSVRSTRTTRQHNHAQDRLHPMWTPTSMWDDDYSTDDDDDEYDNYEHYDMDRLPAGGDTSAHPRSISRISAFPRQMSVRMPGFRGTGGFLLGNSLGVERHGTNKRRHHVELPGNKQSGEQPHTPTPAFLKAIRRHFNARRAAKEELARERRRAELKDMIGVRVVQQI